MKLITKRILGAAAVVVAVLGVIFSVYAVIGVWSTADWLRSETPALLGRVETVAVSVHHQGEMAVGLLTTTRDRLDLIQDTVEELSEDVPDGKIASILSKLDKDVAKGLEESDDFIRSMQDGLRSVGGALLMVESIPLLGATLSHPAVPDESSLKDLASTLTEISDMLDQVRNILSELRTKKTVDRRQVSRLQAALRQIDNRLGQVQSNIEDFSTAMQTAAAGLSETKRKSPQWIHRAAISVTVFFVCFSFSQICVLSHGWTWLRVSSGDATGR